MKRTLVVVAAVVGFATAVSASTFSVISTNSSNVAQNTFVSGETIILKFTGNAQSGGATTFGGIFGALAWDATKGVFVSNSQTPMFATVSPLAASPGLSYIMNQSNSANTAPSTETQIATVTLIAAAQGSSNVSLGAEAFDFFGDYRSSPTDIVHSFTVIPEPATAALIGLGVLGLVLGGRRRV